MKFIGGPLDGQESTTQQDDILKAERLSRVTRYEGPQNAITYIVKDGNLHYQAPQAPPKIEQEGT